MPTIRGFVERLEVGRAGLVTASVCQDDGTRADYYIHDLDADPERFNERLSKLGVLRDAMTRAEPVEIETAGDTGASANADGSGPNEIIRVVRITRDVLAANAQTQAIMVYVVGVALLADNRTGQRAEWGDRATVATMADDGTTGSWILELQMPERATAVAMLDAIRDAQAGGQPVTLTVDTKSQRIVGVDTGSSGLVLGGGGGDTVDGFVESAAVAPGLAGNGNLASVRITTAPPFSGAGNVVELVPFDPVLRSFLVVQGSLEYELFVDALRDKLRVRVMGGPTVGQKPPPPAPAPPPPPPPQRIAAQPAGAGSATSTAAKAIAGTGDGASADQAAQLVRGVQMLAPLCSASRPVWIEISRQSLDVGPDRRCTDGLPTSDLAPASLRDLHIPYTAEWLGCGCFNRGVYRLQFDLTVEFEVCVDGERLCVHASDDGKTKFAHACLCGEHCVKVVLQGWTCDAVFRMDVYRIR
ncbi:MAG TPA: hypothetical protein VGH48_04925 [Caldimonas sp.]